MAFRAVSWCLAVAIAFANSAADAGDFRILYAQPLQIERAASGPRVRAAAPTRLDSLSFQAYGRQFDLDLQANERLFADLPLAQRESLNAYALYRGTVSGTQGSWVRLTQIGGELRGMIWDGAELYAVSPAREAKPYMLSAEQVADDALVIYRLSDTESDLGPRFCSVLVPGAQTTTLDAYKALANELQQNAAIASAVVVTGQMQVAVIGDFEFFSDHPGNAQALVVDRMNTIDGIFSDQVGIHLVVSSVTIFGTDTDPFTTNVPSDLLGELGDYKSATAAIRTTGIAHLMTGRDLDGQTVGIAFLNSLCSARFGVSLSEGGNEVGSTSATLIAAHEMGHNFGAPHDAETDATQDQACASTPATFLMAARLNGSSTFSQCSLDQISPVVDRAACIQPLAFADAAVSVDTATISAQLNVPFNYGISVNTVGALAVDGVTVTVSLPATLVFESANVPTGSCTSGAGSVTCDLGSVPGNSMRRIDLTLHGTEVGTLASTVGLASSNDANAANNFANVTVVVNAPSNPPSGGGGGGGGGALGALGIVGLLLALTRRACATERCA